MDKKFEFENVWGCFIDKKNPRLIILVNHGEKFKELTEQNEIVSESDDDTVKPKNNKKMKIKSKIPCKKQEK